MCYAHVISCTLYFLIVHFVACPFPLSLVITGYISLVMAGSDVVLVGRVQGIGSVCNVVEIVQHSQWC